MTDSSDPKVEPLFPEPERKALALTKKWASERWVSGKKPSMTKSVSQARCDECLTWL